MYFGGGLERILAASINSPDVFRISLMWPIIEKLQQISGKKYESHTESMRVIADHLRAATFLAVDGVVPSNKEQGYVMRRLLRRAIRFAFDLGIEQNFLQQVVPVIAELYEDDYPEVKEHRELVVNSLVKEEKIFRQTLVKGLREFDRIARVKCPDGKMKETNGLIDVSSVANWQAAMTGSEIFRLYDTFGFPAELSLEEAFKRNINTEGWQEMFEYEMGMQRNRSRTAVKGTFKGGLSGETDMTIKYHTAAHLLNEALRKVLDENIVQKGANITDERLRFDFSYPEKVDADKIKQIEDLVNEQIAKDLPVSWKEYPLEEARSIGAHGSFNDKYGNKVKVYSVGDDKQPFSLEICGGPHVERTGQLGEGGKKFKITKEEAVKHGVRRIRAVLV